LAHAFGVPTATTASHPSGGAVAARGGRGGAGGPPPAPRPPLCAGDLRLDPVTHRVWRGETEIEVTAKEFALLETFLRHPGAVFTRQQLLEHCWDFAFESRSNVVEVHIRALRDKIDRRFGVTSLETLRGVGYRLNPVTATGQREPS
ncbi:winged helix-turn-helix domain-containing protein, partial [Nocardia neocaledoniensis]|uniref:winged helix-turn-helix domain-containing protein n=1 Tax=Nocardia neocaledoniensis TaxID=236511 RepID=UPI00245781E4